MRPSQSPVRKEHAIKRLHSRRVYCLGRRHYTATVSEKTFHAYRAYKAAITDPSSSRAEVARLTGDLKEERQADRERARYYRMQEEEDAILAIAAARDYDSDD